MASWSARTASGTVDLWLIPPSLLAGEQAVHASLDASERSRVMGYGDPDKAAWYARKQTALRRILGAYLGCRPAEVRFSHGLRGKPAIAGDARLAFNASHSHGHTVIAVTGDGPVGIDIEYIRTRPRDGLALSLLGLAAASKYIALAAPERSRAFSYAWSEREALGKLLGLGIGDGWAPIRTAFIASDLFMPQNTVAHRNVGGYAFHYLDILPSFSLVICSARAYSSIRVNCLHDLSTVSVLHEWRGV